MSSYQTFRFLRYDFNSATKTARFTYGYDDALTFTEQYIFNFDWAVYNDAALDRSLQLLFFMAGISYYKMYLAPNISVEAGEIDEVTANFLQKTYQKGLGEFFYVNSLDPNYPIAFPVTSKKLNMLSVSGEGQLVGIGGGKDSLVSVELLRDKQPTTWALGHATQLAPLVDVIGLPHIQVVRKLDASIKDHNDNGAYNGHVPISAILACVGVVTAILSGKRDVVVSNEISADEQNLTYRGVSINHQYSKSSEFEVLFQSVLKHHFNDGLRYYSLLRPLREIHIAELFAGIFTMYKSVFCSCNKAFTQDSSQMRWCGDCPKCTFVYLMLAVHVDEADLTEVFGKNLLADTSLQQTYEQLLGIAGDKPLECVGEVAESRYAMSRLFTLYPELKNRFSFELDSAFDPRHLHIHRIPADVYDSVVSRFSS